MTINYDNRIFAPRATSANGEANSSTLFHYHQEGDIVWATYAGGGVNFGTLIATVDASGQLDMRYTHVNARGELMTGICHTTPETLPDGRLRLHERWRWTCVDESAGESVVEEIMPEILPRA